MQTVSKLLFSVCIFTVIYFANLIFLFERQRPQYTDKLILTQNLNGETSKNLFFIIVCVFNPAMFHSRFESYRRFEKHVLEFDVGLITVELASHNQIFQVTKQNNPHHVQLRTNDTIWYKENLINIGLKHLPSECKYVAWVDLEVEFLNQNWVEESIKALETHKVIQLFEFVRILGSKRNIVESHAGYSWCWTAKQNNPNYSATLLHNKETRGLNFKMVNKNIYCTTGYAWAARKSAILNAGGLYDRAIIGDGDAIAAYSFSGEINETNLFYHSRPFVKDILNWQNSTFRLINGSMGFISGSINHLWHGSRNDRRYHSRRRILNTARLTFDPNLHLYYDDHSLVHFRSEFKKYYDASLVWYFQNRNEDK